MTLATDIAGDMADFDGLETVSLFDVSANTTDASVSALRRAVNYSPTQAGGSLGVKPTKTVWHIQQSTTDIVPDEGDTITDASSVVWTIDSVDKATLGTRWRCPCTQQVS
jgi:hypothetical protein